MFKLILLAFGLCLIQYSTGMSIPSPVDHLWNNPWTNLLPSGLPGFGFNSPWSSFLYGNYNPYYQQNQQNPINYYNTLTKDALINRIFPFNSHWENLEIQDRVKSTVCLYIKSSSMFVCSGPMKKTISCQIESNINNKNKLTNIKSFKLGLSETIDANLTDVNIDNQTSSTIDIKIPIYPLFVESNDRKVLKNSEIMLDNQTATFSIYNSENITDFGLRVKNVKCLDAIITSLKLSETQLTSVLDINGNNITVPFYGTVFVYDSLISAYDQLHHKYHEVVEKQNKVKEVDEDTLKSDKIKKDIRHEEHLNHDENEETREENIVKEIKKYD